MSQMSELDSIVQDSINAVGVEETIALLWDAYLTDYPADPAIEAALAALDPHWNDDRDPPEGYNCLPLQ